MRRRLRPVLVMLVLGGVIWPGCSFNPGGGACGRICYTTRAGEYSCADAVADAGSDADAPDVFDAGLVLTLDEVCEGRGGVYYDVGCEFCASGVCGWLGACECRCDQDCPCGETCIHPSWASHPFCDVPWPDDIHPDAAACESIDASIADATPDVSSD